MRQYTQSLNKNFLKVFSIAVMLPFFLFSLLIFYGCLYYMKSTLQDNARHSSHGIAAALAGELDGYRQLAAELEEGEGLGALLAGGEHQGQGAVLFRLFNFLSTASLKGSIHIISADGQIRLSSDTIPPDYSGYGWRGDWGIMRKMRERPGQLVALCHEINSMSGSKNLYSIGKTVYYNNELAGYIIVDFPADSFLKYLEQRRGDFAAGLLLTDEHRQAVTGAGPLLKEGTAAYSQLAALEAEGEVYLGEGTVGGYGLYYYEAISLKTAAAIGRWGLVALVLAYAVLAAAIAAMGQRWAQRIMEPLMRLTAAMKHVREGRQDWSPDSRSGSSHMLGGYFTVIIQEMQTMIEHIREQEKRNALAEKKQLQAQFNPHFLYNTLDVVRWLIKMNQADTAQQTIVNLAKILRYSISDSEEFVLIKNDLEFISSYLDIQKMRFGEAMQYSIDIDPGLLEEYIPKLILQPLVENACNHGLAPLGGGTIRIVWRDFGDSMLIKIENDGAALEKDTAAGQGGFGIYNVRRRLELYYNQASRLQIDPREGGGAEVSIVIPKRSKA